MGKKVSSKSIPRFYLKPRATIRALYLLIIITVSFDNKTHFVEITVFPTGTFLTK